MKFTVAKSDLDRALNVVSPTLSGSGSDISTHFLIRRRPDDETNVEVLSYSNRVFSMCPITLSIRSPRSPLTCTVWMPILICPSGESI